jgi:sugar diacid utilization regulator
MGLFEYFSKEYRELRKNYAMLVENYSRLADDHQRLRETYSSEVGRLLQQNQQQTALLKMADTMHRNMDATRVKIMDLVQRHIEAGQSQVPARALWQVLHDAGFTVQPAPVMDHALRVALKQAPALEQKSQQSQAQKPQQTEQKTKLQQSQQRGMSR